MLGLQGHQKGGKVIPTYVHFPASSPSLPCPVSMHVCMCASLHTCPHRRTCSLLLSHIHAQNRWCLELNRCGSSAGAWQSKNFLLSLVWLRTGQTGIWSVGPSDHPGIARDKHMNLCSVFDLKHAFETIFYAADSQIDSLGLKHYSMSSLQTKCPASPSFCL